MRDPVGVLSRVGYLSEDRDLPGWMRVGELLRYTRAFYPSWDDAFAEELRRRVRPRPAARVKDLSQGSAGAGRPCWSRWPTGPNCWCSTSRRAGLDPIVRRDILGAIIRTIADEGRTVLFSSHLLDEVERVADRVAMIDRGRIVFGGPLDEIRATHRRLTLRFAEPRPRPPALAGVVAWEGSGREWAAVARPGAADAGRGRSGGRRGRRRARCRLDEIFVARAGPVPAQPRCDRCNSPALALTVASVVAVSLGLGGLRGGDGCSWPHWVDCCPAGIGRPRTPRTASCSRVVLVVAGFLR